MITIANISSGTATGRGTYLPGDITSERKLISEVDELRNEVKELRMTVDILLQYIANIQSFEDDMEDDALGDIMAFPSKDMHITM